MRIRLAFASIALAFAITACTSDKEFNAVGIWKGDSEGAEITMVFNADDTGSYSMEGVFAYDVVYKREGNGFVFSLLTNGNNITYHATVKDSSHIFVEEIATELVKQP